jgi:hypothetical protein
MGQCTAGRAAQCRRKMAVWTRYWREASGNIQQQHQIALPRGHCWKAPVRRAVVLPKHVPQTMHCSDGLTQLGLYPLPS